MMWDAVLDFILNDVWIILFVLYIVKLMLRLLATLINNWNTNISLTIAGIISRLTGGVGACLPSSESNIDVQKLKEIIFKSIKPTSGIIINPIIPTPPSPSAPPQNDDPIKFYIDKSTQDDKSTVNKGS